MKLTKTKLRRLIREELQNILDEDNAYLDPPVAKDEEASAAEEEAEKAGGQPGAVYKGSLEEEEEKWIQGAEKDIERRGTEGVCTGDKFGGPTCRPGTKRYNLAKTFRKMAKKRKTA